MIHAVLCNAQHPEYGEATIPFPIHNDDYADCVKLLSALEIGDAVARDCMVKELHSKVSVLKRLEKSKINLDELNYLARRLDSFAYQEMTQFQDTKVISAEKIIICLRDGVEIEQPL